MKLVVALHRWHLTRTGLAVFGLAELGAAMLLISLAFETGSLLQYLLVMLLLVGALQNVVRFVRTFWGAPTSADAKRGAQR